MKKGMKKVLAAVALVLTVGCTLMGCGESKAEKERKAEKREAEKQSDDIDTISEFKAAVESYIADDMADGDDCRNVTISVSGTKISVTGGGSEHKVSEAMDELGISNARLKSDGWGSFEAVYDVQNFVWTGITEGENSNSPHKDLSSAFY